MKHPASVLYGPCFISCSHCGLVLGGPGVSALYSLTQGSRRTEASPFAAWSSCPYSRQGKSLEREPARPPLHFVTSSYSPWARTRHMSARSCEEAAVWSVLGRKAGLNMCGR